MYCSVASLLAAYGLTGIGVIRSCLGNSGLAPYTDEELATMTNGLRPFARAASSTFMVPVAFA